MATLEPNSDQVIEAMALLMGFINSAGIPADVGIYALCLANYVGCRNSLAMTDADYMRFCETIMHWGQHLLVVLDEGQNNG